MFIHNLLDLLTITIGSLLFIIFAPPLGFALLIALIWIGIMLILYAPVWVALLMLSRNIYMSREDGAFAFRGCGFVFIWYQGTVSWTGPCRTYHVPPCDEIFDECPPLFIRRCAAQIRGIPYNFTWYIPDSATMMNSYNMDGGNEAYAYRSVGNNCYYWYSKKEIDDIIMSGRDIWSCEEIQ